MRKKFVGVLIAVSVVAFLVIVLFSGWIWVTRQPYPKTRGKITAEGLSAQVEVFRDRYGVPHIYARTAEDLFFAQGFVHAQDRFWQMEFWRRLGAGRMSELFGEKLLETDKFLRTMGFLRVAQQEVETVSPETRRYLEAYSSGVNAYILNRRPTRLGLEFAILKLQGVEFEIEPWTPAHSICWAKMMAYDLGTNYSLERLNLAILRSVGLDRWSDFFAGYREDMPVIISDEELPQLAQAPVTDPAEPWRVFGTEGIGSNSWVISGKRTKSGKPLLANDMHLGIQMPSIWYEIGLHGITEDGQVGRTERCPFHLRGYSFPGVFGVIAGHNDRIAWGLTNLSGDVQDLYIERINPSDPDQYEVNGEWVDMEISYEEIEINEEDEPYRLRVRHTRHGPVMTDLKSWDRLNNYFVIPETENEFPENMGFTVLALRWTALEPGTLLQAVIEVDRARNFEEFREALRQWDVPGQNFVYADVDGNIGYQAPGRYPLRTRGSGLAPVPGWSDEYEWQGFVPFEQLPYVYNPPKGYIVTANNPVTGPNYPIPFGSTFSYGYRARRIDNMIKEDSDGVTVEDIARMHGDTFDQAAFEIVPYLRGLDLKIKEDDKDHEESEREKRKREKKEGKELEQMDAARERLFTWNKRMDMDSAEAVLYGYFWIELVEETFRDQYPESNWQSRGQSRFKNAFFYLLEEPDNPFWDDRGTPDKRETRDDILVEAFRNGYRAAVDSLGDKMDKWEWGEVHTSEFRNATFGSSGIAPIEKIFNRGPVETRGDTNSVSAAAWVLDEPFEVTWISSQRAIYDMGDLSATLMVHTTGQSGHPTHRHYDDFIEPWRLIEYHPSHWEREAVEKASSRRLLLQP